MNLLFSKVSLLTHVFSPLQPHFRSRSLTRKAKKRKFDDGDGDEEMDTTSDKRIRPSSIARARSQSKNRSESGLRDVAVSLLSITQFPDFIPTQKIIS